jgi:hypothetical protein
MRPIPALSLALLAFACAGDPTAPRTASAYRAGDVSNIASDVPNVFRVKGEFAVGILDDETDLIAIAGLPANPLQLVDCGGPEGVQVADWQFVGDKIQAAIKALVKLDPANLFVYRLSTFVDPCVSTPLAQGTGRVMYTDSDIFYTGGGNDAWGFRMEGTVTLATGGTAHLLAHNRFQIKPDGSFRRIFRHVTLNRL